MEADIKVFFAYAHEDEKLRNQLEKQLSLLKWQGLITCWHDRRIGAGIDWVSEVNTHLNTASIILLLVSPDFLASDYCFSIEVKRAMERHEAGEAHVIPIILRPVFWKKTLFGKLQALPRNAKAVTSWQNRDEAFFDIAEGIRKAAEELVAKPLSGSSIPNSI
jgi:TIR domain